MTRKEYDSGEPTGFLAREMDLTLDHLSRSRRTKTDLIEHLESVESIAIEVETGKSDVVSNVKRDLREEVQKVLVVAVDEGALKKVEQQLAMEGLLIPGRVEVVLWDELQPVS